MRPVNELTDSDLRTELDQVERAIGHGTLAICLRDGDDGDGQIKDVLTLVERQHSILQELRRRAARVVAAHRSVPVTSDPAETITEGVVSAQIPTVRDRLPVISADDVAEAARQIGAAEDLVEAAAVVVKFAVEWTGASWAEVVEPPGRRPFRILAATDIALAESMYRSRQLTDENPPLPDLRPSTDRIVIENLLNDGRWASLTEVATTVPVRAAVLQHLVVEGRYSAGLAVYDQRPSYFTTGRLRSIQLLAAISAPLLAGAAAAEEVRQLRIAIGSNRAIGAAVGVLMYTEGLDQRAAFNALVERSRHENRKLSAIAADLLADLPRERHRSTTPVGTGR